MLKAFSAGTPAPVPIETATDSDALRAALRGALWIDLLAPTEEERALVEAATGVELPTEAEIAEIESSSRVSIENGVVYLSMPMLTQVDTSPHSASMGYVLRRHQLITLRFRPSRVFDAYAARLQRGEMADQGGPRVFIGLMEAIVDRLADVMERSRSELDAISARIFHDGARQASAREDLELRATLRGLGRIGDLDSRVRDSLLGARRIVSFLAQVEKEMFAADLRVRLKTLRQDIGSLTDYDIHVSNKIQFLLDATLGFINIQQNNIMKVFTVCSVAGIPPVLLAGVWGMNFEAMPELKWGIGYPLALLVIVCSAAVPLLWFRKKGWL
jgi:magnesium transporter